MKLFGKNRKSASPLDEALSTDQVPSLSAVALKVMRLLRDPDSDLVEIAEELAFDPGLVVHILSTVNSTAYAPCRPIQDLQHGVAYLGREQTEHMVLSFAVKEALPTTSAPGFEAARFWKTAAFRAVLARSLAATLHPESENQCFLAGLLQDLALPILANATPDSTGPLLNKWNSDPTTHLHELEDDALGWNHSDIGASLARKWELPEFLVKAIGGHHDSTAVPPAVYLVSHLRESDTEHGINELEHEACETFGLKLDHVHSMIEDSVEKAEDFSRVFI